MLIGLRVPLALAAGVVLLGGCTHRDTARTTATTSSSSTSTTRSKPAETRPAVARRTHTAKQSTESAATEVRTDPAARTGIVACDDYLSSYLACHRAAQIYAPDQLQSRYQAMRTSLLRDAKDPDIRPQLGARCNSLATQLRQALHGKACDTEPASTASSP